jgi:dinuclear metal center YbgI/SA1388 family protein
VILLLLETIENYLNEKVAPKAYLIHPEIHGLHYDHSNKRKLIKKVMLTVDLTMEAIHEAVKNKTNLLLSHHGLFEYSINKFSKELINKLNLLTRYPISIYVLNSPFIAVECGISETIMELFSLKLENVFEIENSEGLLVPIGRICEPIYYSDRKREFTLEMMIKRIKANLNQRSVRYAGNLTKSVHKICIVGGDFFNPMYIRKAIEYGSECYISSTIDHTSAKLALDLGINIIEVPHFDCELVALKKLKNILSLEFPEIEFTVFDSKNPIDIYI